MIHIRFGRRLLPAIATLLLLLPAVARADDGPAAPSLPAIAATVNGESIPTQEWLSRVQTVGFNDFNGSLRTRRMVAGQLALEQLINERVILQYAAKVGFLPTDAEVAHEVEAQESQPTIKERLAQKQITEAQLRNAVRYQKTLQSFITINQTISPEEVRAYYNDGYARKWQAAMIHTSTLDAAQRARAALMAGESFGAVAARLSEDPESKLHGGELRGSDGKPRWFGSRDPALSPSALAAIASLKNPGDVTAIVETAGADGVMSWYLFELLGRFTANDEDFNRMRDQIGREALFAKALKSGAAEMKLNDARREAKITISLPGYESMAGK